MKKKQYFLSYSEPDRAIALKLEQELEQLGVDVINHYQELPQGPRWARAALRAIEKAHRVVFVSSMQAARTPSWQTFEFGLAEALKKDLVVMKPAGQSMQDLPREFSGLPSMDFEPGMISAVARRLVGS